MIGAVQGVISADVTVPLLKGSRDLLETLKALSACSEALGPHGITVEEVTLLWHALEETHPMLTRQVDGIGISNGTSLVRSSTRRLVGTVHVQEVLGNDGIHMTGSSQGVSVVHSSYRQTDGQTCLSGVLYNK